MHPTDETRQRLSCRTSPGSLGRRGRVAATTTAAALLTAAGVGIGIAVSAPRSHSHATTSTSHTHPPTSPHVHGADVDRSARQDWLHQYGQDRSTMPNRPDLAAATPQQRAAASDLLSRKATAAAAYSDIAQGEAAGYDLPNSLARAEQRNPGLARRMQLLDSGAMPQRMPMLRVINKTYLHDGKVLDPSAPETLMYEYLVNGSWKLVGVMFVANEAYPQAPPVPGGPITRWHYHGDLELPMLMMHLFFVPVDGLASGYALTMEGM